jgi:hypothetical protein
VPLVYFFLKGGSTADVCAVRRSTYLQTHVNRLGKPE